MHNRQLKADQDEHDATEGKKVVPQHFQDTIEPNVSGLTWETDERSLKIGRRPRLRSPDCRTGQWKEVMIPITELYKRYNAIQQSIVTDVFNDVRCFFVAAPWRLLSTSVLLALSHVP